MDELRSRMEATIRSHVGAPSSAELARYDLVVVRDQQVSSGPAGFAKNEIALACPDVYEVRGLDVRAVYSIRGRGHMILPLTALAVPVKQTADQPGGPSQSSAPQT